MANRQLVKKSVPNARVQDLLNVPRNQLQYAAKMISDTNRQGYEHISSISQDKQKTNKKGLSQPNFSNKQYADKIDRLLNKKKKRMK